MNLIDIREPNGPYWAAYQAYRHRENVTDDPDRVPEWFLARLARERVAAARVELQKVAHAKDESAQEAWHALRVVEQFLQLVGTTELVGTTIVAGLLGAQEIATARERREAEDAALQAEIDRRIAAPQRGCPDGGYCHHLCVERPCYRVACCGPLSGVFPDDEWPAEVRAAEEARGHA